MPSGTPSKLVWIAVAAALGALECGGTTPLDNYLEGRDVRAESYCQCFGPLIGIEADDGGYGDVERAECIEEHAFEDYEVACIEAALIAPRFAPDDALNCLAATEHEYATCLDALDCEDYEGLDACVEDFNEARQKCPRLSVEDEMEFQRCIRV